ncbi:hypothetical protein [Dongia sp. agr-C8]
MIVEPKREILLGPLLRAGFRRSWDARDHFLRLAVVPLAAMLCILVPLQQVMLEAMAAAQPNQIPEDGGAMPLIALLAVAYAATLAVFSVNWLRQLTLGMDAAPGIGLSLNGRHLRFFLLFLSTSIGSGFVALILMLLLAGFGMPGVMAALLASLLIWAALVVRISPSWIGIALDAPMPLKTAWKRTAGQGFKLLIALIAVEVPLMVVEQLIESLFAATLLIQYAPLTFTLITAVLQLVGIAIQLAILVTAFPYFLRETV